MDSLFSKYGNPFIFLDSVIETKRFDEFVVEFVEIRNEEKMWDFYLHKVDDKSFDDFKKSIDNKPEITTAKDIETTVKQSVNILKNFIPDKKGVK